MTNRETETKNRGDLNIFSLSLPPQSLVSRQGDPRERERETEEGGVVKLVRMKLSSKTMSSPGRTEKFPPPLMRFLRSNAASRSRGRSRSSPMFVRKKNVAIETQEPSSPKVTCIGQVRVKRSKQGSGKAKEATSKAQKRTPGRCKWIRDALCCNHFVAGLKKKKKKKQKQPMSFRSIWRKWVSFFRVGCRRNSEIREDSSRMESKLGDRREESVDSDDVGNDEEAEARVLYPSSFSPPKNALLLTRCRSAPYRSSSLASRFWGLPLASEEDDRKTEQESRVHEQRDPASGNGLASRDSAAESITDPETDRDPEYSKDSASGRSAKPTKTNALKTGEEEEEDEEEEEEAVTARPPVLTRCKSEPARTGARLNPDTTTLFWKKRRPGFAEPRSPPTPL